MARFLPFHKQLLGRGGPASGESAAPVTDYFNGFELSGSTYSGGPTVVADNTGALVTSPAGVMPIEGMRLATTVADGAVLGPELVGQPIDLTTSAWIAFEATKISASSYQTTTGSGRVIRGITTAGKKYLITADATGPFRLRNSSTGVDLLVGSGAVEIVAVGAYELQLAATETGTPVVINSISVREVIPTWVATTSLGAPIHPSTPLRTRKGTVSVYGEDFRGPLVEPARTNLFLNSTAPVTQNITTTAQAYTVTVLGTGSITLSGTATGTATQGSPLTVTASAGTLTCTVTGTLTRVNVEAGAFGTSFIDTAATTVTRPAANLTRPTAGTALESGNNFAIYGRVVPKAGGGDFLFPVSSYIDSSNSTAILMRPTLVRFLKRISGMSIEPGATYTHAANTPFEYLTYQHSVHGMGIAVRSWNGSAWSAWSAWATNANTQNAPIASTYQIGARDNASHFAANYPFTKIIALNPALNPQTQITNMLAKGRI